MHFKVRLQVLGYEKAVIASEMAFGEAIFLMAYMIET